MKILNVSKFYPPVIGGVEKVVYDLATGLQDKVDMNVVVANTKFKYEKSVEGEVNIHRLSSLGKYFSMPVAPTYPLWLKKIEADIFHFHFPFPLGDISYLLTKPKGKTVVTWHSDIVKQKKLLKVYGPFLNKFLDEVDCIVATSPNLIENSRYLKKYKEKVTVIPLGVEHKPFIESNKIEEEKVRKIKEKYHNQTTILFIGRLIYYKGVDYLIKAMNDVKNAKLLLVGTGDLEEELKQLTASLKLEDKVEFLGVLSDEDLRVHLKACDFLTLPSIEPSEAFGLVQAEAMLCGKPVVSTNLPTGVPFVNDHRSTGIVVPPKDVDALSIALQELVNNEDLRRAYGNNAKKRALEMFTKEKMAESYYELYKQLLNN